MKKFFALFMVVAMLTFVGTAFAEGDDTAGHVIIGELGVDGSENPKVTYVTVDDKIIKITILNPDSLKSAAPTDIKAKVEAKVADLFPELNEDEINTIIDKIIGVLSEWNPSLSGTHSSEVRASVAMGDNSTLTVNQITGDVSERAAQITADLGGKYTPVYLFPEITAATTAAYAFPTVFDEAVRGLPIYGVANVKSDKTVGSTSMIFLNSAGERTTTIPADGFVTVVIYMDANTKYIPAVVTSVAEAKVKGATSEKTITYNPGTVQASTTNTFSTYVPLSLILDTEYNTIPVSAVKSGWEDSDAESITKEGTTSSYMFTVLALPSISAPAEPTWYIAAVSFDKGDSGLTASDLYSTALTFYPNNVNAASGTARYFKEGSDGKLAAITASDIFGSSSRYTSGYLAFQLSSAANKPAVNADIKKADAPDVLTIKATPNSVTFDSPTASAKTVTLSAENASGTVTYSAEVSPTTTGLSASVSGNTLTLTPSAAGSYTVTVTGTDGVDTATAMISVTVSSGSTAFAIYASPATVTFATPAADPQIVTLSSNYNGGAVTYTASVNPAFGLDASVSGSIMTLDPSLAGTYTVTVTGNNGTDTATTTVSVTVNPSGTLKPGGSSGGGCDAGFSALALAVLGGFIARRKK